MSLRVVALNRKVDLKKEILGVESPGRLPLGGFLFDGLKQNEPWNKALYSHILSCQKRLEFFRQYETLSLVPGSNLPNLGWDLISSMFGAYFENEFW